MEKFGVKYTSICYEKWGTHALFCSRHSHNFSKDETTLYIARATIKMPFKVRFLASGITIEILTWAAVIGKTTDYGHMMAKSLILCSPNSNSNPNRYLGFGYKSLGNIHVLRNCVLVVPKCPFVGYFRTLFWDDITKICWWKLSKQTSYWSKTDFFFLS